MRRFLHAVFFLSILTLGCQTPRGVVLQETPLNISETRRVIVSVIGEPKSLSENGRELISRYYDKKNKFIEKMDMAKERIYTLVTISGDRRPYDITVDVVIEARSPDGNFEQVDHDDGRAQQIADKIKAALHLSRDKRNVIDDFRSF